MPNRRKTKSCFGQVFNSKLGHIGSSYMVSMSNIRYLLELKPQAGFILSANICPSSVTGSLGHENSVD